jgi:hypothetical protein
MNYYLVRQTSDPKVIGVRNGESQADLVRNELTNSFTFDYFEKYIHGDGDKHSYWKIFDTPPKENLDLGLIELKNKAKLTDFISFHPNALANGEFLISRRASELFKRFHLPSYQLIPVTLVKDRQTIDSYEYLFCNCLGYEFVDFPKSVFYDGPIMRRNYIRIENSKDFEFQKDDRLLRAEKVVLKGLANSLDYFSLKVTMTGFYISERLKQAIESTGLTGLNILEMKEPYEPRIEIV